MKDVKTQFRFKVPGKDGKAALAMYEVKNGVENGMVMDFDSMADLEKQIFQLIRGFYWVKHNPQKLEGFVSV